jgi:hypothetical protein
MEQEKKESTQNLTLVVLAAGIGSRYGGLKQVEPVGPSGERIIDYSIYDALQCGFNKVVFVISKAIEDIFRETVGKKIEAQCETEYVFQSLDDLPGGYKLPDGRVKPWGTGHATLCSWKAVHSPFSVINADDFYGQGAFQAIAEYLGKKEKDDHRPESMDFCMVGYRLENTLTEHGHVARGICSVNSQGFLTNITERTRIEKYGNAARFTEDSLTWKDLSLDTIVSMNMWGFTPALFPELQARFEIFLGRSGKQDIKAEYFLPSVVNDLIFEHKARVKVLDTNEKWYGMTYAEDRPAVRESICELVRQGRYPEALWGVPLT